MATVRQVRRQKLQQQAEGYLELGMPRHALETLGRLGDLASLDGYSLYLSGEALRSMERYFEALMPLERAAKTAPENIHIRLALGWCYKRTGRLDLAIDALEQALLARPDEPLLRYNLACYLSLAGQKRRAIRYLSQAMTLDPTYRRLAETESDFDSLRADPRFQSLCSQAESQS
jgi:Flp pilus assembly protein TadD